MTCAAALRPGIGPPVRFTGAADPEGRFAGRWYQVRREYLGIAWDCNAKCVKRLEPVTLERVEHLRTKTVREEHRQLLHHDIP